MGGPGGPGDAGDDPRRHAPATLRNRNAIAAVLVRELPPTGTVLEVASGSGEHVAHFAPLFPMLMWQPSDVSADALASIAAWTRASSADNVRPPLALDAAAHVWPIASADAMLCINMVHISPWAATQGLLAGAARLLPAGAPLILYGPFLEDDVPTAASNLDFDQSLRVRNPAWGLRRRAAIDRLATESGFERTARHAMPANNLTLVYRLRSG